MLKTLTFFPTNCNDRNHQQPSRFFTDLEQHMVAEHNSSSSVAVVVKVTFQALRRGKVIQPKKIA